MQSAVVRPSDMRKLLSRLQSVAERSPQFALVATTESILAQLPQTTEQWFDELFCPEQELMAMMETRLESELAEMKKAAKSFRFSDFQKAVFEEWHNNNRDDPVQELMRLLLKY